MQIYDIGYVEDYMYVKMNCHYSIKNMQGSTNNTAELKVQWSNYVCYTVADHSFYSGS